jgi:hypothetical protein
MDLKLALYLLCSRHLYHGRNDLPRQVALWRIVLDQNRISVTLFFEGAQGERAMVCSLRRLQPLQVGEAPVRKSNTASCW